MAVWESITGYRGRESPASRCGYATAPEAANPPPHSVARSLLRPPSARARYPLMLCTQISSSFSFSLCDLILSPPLSLGRQFLRAHGAFMIAHKRLATLVYMYILLDIGARSQIFVNCSNERSGTTFKLPAPAPFSPALIFYGSGPLYIDFSRSFVPCALRLDVRARSRT